MMWRPPGFIVIMAPAAIGTAPAARGPMNISDSTTKSMCLVALKHVFPEVPVNGGAFRPTRFTIPARTVLAAEYPSPVGGTTDVTQRVVDVVFGALAQAIPQLVPAAPFGTATPGQPVQPPAFGNPVPGFPQPVPGPRPPGGA